MGQNGPLRRAEWEPQLQALVAQVSVHPAHWISPHSGEAKGLTLGMNILRKQNWKFPEASAAPGPLSGLRATLTPAQVPGISG